MSTCSIVQEETVDNYIPFLVFPPALIYNINNRVRYDAVVGGDDVPISCKYR